ncbi:substrate-binding periplasmic protein [Vibrio algicola]|uniref:Transporter substrate-binding domain-containing protein n=1 Tax=Vibrio algicola TaxID=2662262 RepID=A0A5Q0TC45_9VIBR|nr:transporter substrate-binding domain-containing protein [Vibrio algicola]
MQKKLRTSIESYQFEIRQQALRKAVTEAGIDRNTPIKVKFENLIQFSQYAKDGSVYGISADILNKACKILDLQCNIISHANEAWDDMYADLRNKKIDILGPVTFTASRKKAMYFSQEYFLPEAIAVKREGYKEGTYKNVSEMIVERISVIKGDYYDHLLTDMLPQKKLYRLRSRDEQIKSLLAGKTDYAILNKQNFNKMQQGNDAMLPIVEDALIGSFHRSELGFAFVKTEKGKKLADLFTLAINLVDTTPIINKYDVQPDWRAMTQKEQKSNQVFCGF